MALIKCPECGKEVSDLKEACPYCGYNLRAASTEVKGNTDAVYDDKVVIAERKRESLNENKTLGIVMIIIGAVLTTALVGIVLIIIGASLLSKSEEVPVKHECAYYSQKNDKIIFYNEKDEDIVCDVEQVVSVYLQDDKLYANLMFSNIVNSHCIGSCTKEEMERCKSYIVDLKVARKTTNEDNTKPE